MVVMIMEKIKSLSELLEKHRGEKHLVVLHEFPDIQMRFPRRLHIGSSLLSMASM